MLRAHETVAGPVEAGDAEDSVTLDHDDRRRRRMVLTAASGRQVLLDLAETPNLRHGDGIVLEDGTVLRVEAAPEALLEIGARDARHLVRLAWHLGNRHLPTEIVEGEAPALRIRTDHVIADMARRLGATVEEIHAPFNPEGGAYGHGGTAGHDHGHHHGHSHSHDHGHHHAHTPDDGPHPHTHDHD